MTHYETIQPPASPQPTNNLCPLDGEIYLIQGFYEKEDACRLFSSLRDTLAWRFEDIVIAGKTIRVPRLVCWYGDPDARYSYSSTLHDPLPWTPTLVSIKGRVEEVSRHDFNGMLGNLYRNGNDSMGWHSDNERELGNAPWIASLSLGETRLFKLRHNKTKQTLVVRLENGSLLLMGGPLQHRWRHCLPKTRRTIGPRINLTFRRIRATAGGAGTY